MASNNARIIEKDILAAIPAGANGNSETVDLNGAGKFSCQAIYDVQAPSAQTVDSGESEIDTFTFESLANTDPGDYMVVYDTTGLAWAAAADTTGTDPEPTGAVWVSIPAARKVFVDISGATDAESVAALFETALNGLTDVPFVADDSGGSGDLAVTVTLRGVCDAPEVHNEDDSGAGSIVAAVTNAGVNSEVDIEENTFTIPGNTFPTGTVFRVTATGTLPAPLLVATDYFVIVVNSNTIQLATSRANALAGTAINITTQGSDGNVTTLTATALSGASITFQCSNNAENWVDIQTATSITVDGSVMLSVANVAYRYFRAVKALTAGIVDLQALTLVIGDDE